MIDRVLGAETRSATFTPLGLQLRDPLSDRPVGAGLDVTARRRAGGRVSRAFLTPSAVHAFHHLEGLRSLETFPPDDVRELAAVPSEQVEIVVAAVDRAGRFLPLVLTVAAPHWGLVTSEDVLAASVPGGGPIYLFSAPARTLAPGTAVVRARVAGTSGTPLAFAIVEVSLGPDRWAGISDVDGSVAVAFPSPTFGGAVLGSPVAGTAGTPPDQQVWTVSIAVRSDLAVLDLVDGIPARGREWPTLTSLFAQPHRDIVPAVGSPAAASLTLQLKFGRDLVVRTTDQEDALLLVDGVAP